MANSMSGKHEPYVITMSVPKPPLMWCPLCRCWTADMREHQAIGNQPAGMRHRKDTANKKRGRQQSHP